MNAPLLDPQANATLGKRINPRRYFESIGVERTPVAVQEPVCLYLEVTNRCNLFCTTCPRTFEELEPPSDMSWELFTRIVNQFPNIERVVLHGVGEPMMVAGLPKMVRYLKERGVHVLFNTNGTLMREKKSRELIEAGLDEMRISLDAAEPKAFEAVRGRDLFDRIVRNIRNFVALKNSMGATNPRLSLWLTGLRETLEQLPAFIRLAHGMGVMEVHLQRLVYFDAGPFGLARPASSLFEQRDRDEGKYLLDAEKLAAELGVFFDASGAVDPESSLRPSGGDAPWSLCRRPWSLMYLTAPGRALPCCIAPFSIRGDRNFTLGDASTTPLREIWNGREYRTFREALLSDNPPASCSGCGLRWSL